MLKIVHTDCSARGFGKREVSPLVNSPEGFLASLNKVFAINNIWAVLVPRLPKVGRLPDDKALIEKILAQASQNK